MPTVFGKGYGEEADFCLRARRRGWSHHLAADVFVYHAGGLSFGGRRAALLERSQRLINLRHPGYDDFIASFQAQDPLHPIRRRLDERRLSAFAGRFVLLVTLALTGGVDRFVAERCRSLRAQGLFPLVLRPAEAGNARRCELWTDAMGVPNLSYDIPQELASLTALLGTLRLEGIELQHFLGLDARVIEAVRALPVPYDVFVHDYAWICPRVTLIDGSGRYCGEPAVSVCQVCVRRNGSHLGEAISVPALRERSASVAAHCAPSARALGRYGRTPEETLCGSGGGGAAPYRTRRAHAAPAAGFGGEGAARRPHRCHRRAQGLSDLAPLRAGCTGAPAADRICRDRLYPERRTAARDRQGLRHGPLQRDRGAAPAATRAARCRVAPLRVAGDLVLCARPCAQRRIAGGGLRSGRHCRARARCRNGVAVAAAARAPADQRSTAAARQRSAACGPTASRSVQTQLSGEPDDAKLLASQSGEMPMVKTSEGKPAPAVPEEGLGAAVQVLALPAGLYLFSVKSASAAPVRGSGQLSVPAVHVGLGPGVRSEQVEFIAGPSTHGAWLFAPGDLLVAKVNDTGATLILTSVRAPSGEVLSIKVERLDARAGAAAAAAPALQSAPPAAPAPAAPAKKPSVSVATSPDSARSLPIQIGAHIRTRGDMRFVDVPWAGRVGPGLWVESFSIRPLERLGAQDVEYKAPHRQRVRDPLAQRRQDVWHQRHGRAAGRLCGAAQTRSGSHRVRLRIQRLLPVRRHGRPAAQRCALPLDRGERSPRGPPGPPRQALGPDSARPQRHDG